MIIGKEEITLSLFTYDMIVYVENLKYSTKTKTPGTYNQLQKVCRIQY